MVKLVAGCLRRGKKNQIRDGFGLLFCLKSLSIYTKASMESGAVSD